MEVDIPQRLQQPAAAALTWFNQRSNSTFEVSGVVDFEEALLTKPLESFEFGLVLCDGEICDKVQIRCIPDGDGFNFSVVERRPGDIPVLLDPPNGIRANWLDRVLDKHEFVVLLFYRGLW
jgi:hypothetical protein